jgi:plastocyanin
VSPGGGQSPTPPAGGEASASASVIAENTQFDTAELSLSAGAPTKLSFDNRDAGVLHNLSIYPGDPAESPGVEPAFTFEPFPGPEARTFTIPALDAGGYVFICDVHPSMRGDVTVA